jgi:hypothetical protein
MLVGQGTTFARRYRALMNWWRDPDSFYLNYPEKLGQEHLREKMLVIGYLRAKSQPGDQVYVWSFQALIYYLTGLRSPTRFVPNFPLMSSWGPPAWRSELMRDLHRSHPAFIVVARHDGILSITLSPLDSEQYLKVFPELGGFIHEDYRPVATFSDFVVYGRKPSST